MIKGKRFSLIWNSRSVSVLSTFSKIFERLTHKQIISDINAFLSPFNHNYWKAFRTQFTLASTLSIFGYIKSLRKNWYINDYGSVEMLLRSFLVLRKHLPRGVLRKKWFENMEQIYRRTPIPKCDFNNVSKHLYWNRTSAWVFSCKFAAYCYNTFF